MNGPAPCWLWLLIGAVLLVPNVLALAAAVGLLWMSVTDRDWQPTLGTGALIAAILGTPFLIWRTMVAERQVAIAHVSLFSDTINAAAEGLAARRQVTRVVGRGKERLPGRLQDIDDHDLRRGDIGLQGFNPGKSNFDNAMLREARLDGAILNAAGFRNADLLDATFGFGGAPRQAAVAGP